ncbi:hypothetical protein L596_016718 [Steinernema carpocapsae]|uniref:Uncharacterized protein n=1 Tax=Steinernema carpocapsae TaxID=34508 RepID=A0A4V6XWA1_STECR|nr:hypothetical protein L596_016718 [Steinernema carpocapsae]
MSCCNPWTAATLAKHNKSSHRFHKTQSFRMPKPPVPRQGRRGNPRFNGSRTFQHLGRIRADAEANLELGGGQKRTKEPKRAQGFS